MVALLKTQIDPELLKRDQENMAEKKETTEGKDSQRSWVDLTCAGLHPGDITERLFHQLAPTDINSLFVLAVLRSSHLWSV